MNMTPEQQAASDGSTRIDFSWLRKLRHCVKSTPLPATINEAVAPLARVGVDVLLLQGTLSDQGKEWGKQKHLEGLNLHPKFIHFALAIYAYTLGDPQV